MSEYIAPSSAHLPHLSTLLVQIEAELRRRKIPVDEAEPIFKTKNTFLLGKKLAHPEKRTGLEWRLECNPEQSRSYVNFSLTVDGHHTIRLIFYLASLETLPFTRNWETRISGDNFEIVLAHEQESPPEFRETYHRAIPELPKAGSAVDEVPLFFNDAMSTINRMVELYWHPHNA